ncbi:esterase-like activity of phytase family protein [Hyphomonas sp.]|uniref:esterase-like activity of phytase family protein n=1 Tax=Hyphomonas sp. TaxID=87 RepID=UPI00391B46F8
MRFFAALPLILALAAAPACAAPQKLQDGPVAAAPAADPGAPLWHFETATPGLVAASCPAGVQNLDPLPIDLMVSPLAAADTARLNALMPSGATLAGAWELSSRNPLFGGLSGLARLPEDEGGGLLAVTDEGHFAWITLEGGAPASAALSAMRRPDGQSFASKQDMDAEGLLYQDGIALVSFERNHRIEAFALGHCGAAARAAQVASLPETQPATQGGRQIDPNQGAEAIFLTPQGTLGFGYEGTLGVSPLGEVLAGGTARWTGVRAPAPRLHGLVAKEIAVHPQTGETLPIYLFRAWDPLRGNRIELRWGEGDPSVIRISRPAPVDNFEGLAAEWLEDGRLRLWIISDDNFNRSQRTLLFAFDISL